MPAVVITFDDAWTSQYTEAFSYMASKGVVGTSYVIGSRINAANYTTAAQTLEMRAGGWSMANHTIDETHLDTLTQAQQEAQFTGGRDALTAIGVTGNDTLHVAWPGGHKDANTPLAMAATGMLTGRDNSGVQPNALPFADLYALPNSPVLGNTLLATMTGWIDTAKSQRKVYIVSFHKIVETVVDNTVDCSIANFRAFIDYVAASGVQTLTIDELYRLHSSEITVSHQ